MELTVIFSPWRGLKNKKKIRDICATKFMPQQSDPDGKDHESCGTSRKRSRELLDQDDQGSKVNICKSSPLPHLYAPLPHLYAPTSTDPLTDPAILVRASQISGRNSEAKMDVLGDGNIYLFTPMELDVEE